MDSSAPPVPSLDLTPAHDRFLFGLIRLGSPALEHTGLEQVMQWVKQSPDTLGITLLAVVHANCLAAADRLIAQRDGGWSCAYPLLQAAASSQEWRALVDYGAPKLDHWIERLPMPAQIHMFKQGLHSPALTQSIACCDPSVHGGHWPRTLRALGHLSPAWLAQASMRFARKGDLPRFQALASALNGDEIASLARREGPILAKHSIAARFMLDAMTQRIPNASRFAVMDFRNSAVEMLEAGVPNENAGAMNEFCEAYVSYQEEKAPPKESFRDGPSDEPVFQ